MLRGTERRLTESGRRRFDENIPGKRREDEQRQGAADEHTFQEALMPSSVVL